MDVHLERKISFVKTPDKSLYRWCLQEHDEDGSQVGGDQIPWEWGAHFYCTDLSYIHSLEYGAEDYGASPTELPDSEKFTESERISGRMKPGFSHSERSWWRHPSFSMLGTQRKITNFLLRIYPINDTEEEKCGLWGCVSYTSEVDFRDETEPDTIELRLMLRRKKFARFAEALKRREIVHLGISINNVEGFYSEWTPSITTQEIKVLCPGRDQEIHFSDDSSDRKVPRLGKIKELSLQMAFENEVSAFDESQIHEDAEGEQSFQEGFAPGINLNEFNGVIGSIWRNLEETNRKLQLLVYGIWAGVGLVVGAFFLS